MPDTWMIWALAIVIGWIAFHLMTKKIDELTLELVKQHRCSPWGAKIGAWMLFFRWGWRTTPPTLKQKKVHSEVQTSL